MTLLHDIEEVLTLFLTFTYYFYPANKKTGSVEVLSAIHKRFAPTSLVGSIVLPLTIGRVALRDVVAALPSAVLTLWWIVIRNHAGSFYLQDYLGICLLLAIQV
jgi:hypothetical protein